MATPLAKSVSALLKCFSEGDCPSDIGDPVSLESPNPLTHAANLFIGKIAVRLQPKEALDHTFSHRQRRADMLALPVELDHTAATKMLHVVTENCSPHRLPEACLCNCSSFGLASLSVLRCVLGPRPTDGVPSSVDGAPALSFLEIHPVCLYDADGSVGEGSEGIPEHLYADNLVTVVLLDESDQ